MQDVALVKRAIEAGGSEPFPQDLRSLAYKHVFRFMKARQLKPHYFCEAMEIAAKSGVLPFDFNFPPRPIVAKFIHVQLSGDARQFDKEDFGSRSASFQSLEQKFAWRKALQTFLRSMFRYALIARIKQERRFSALPSPATAVDLELDVSGKWIRVVDDEELVFADMIRKLSGVQLGLFYGKMMDAMFQKLDISICKEAILLQGEKKLFTNSSFLFYLDGKPHAFAMPQPIPFPGHAGKQWVCSWIDSTPGDECIKTVGGGPVTAGPASQLAGIGETTSESSTSNELLHKSVDIRMAGKAQLSRDRTTLFIHLSMHTFPKNKAPPFTSVASLDGLFSNDHGSRVSTQHLQFVRYFNLQLSPRSDV